MIILIAGASHTGKTYLAQQLMEKHKIPYLSIDHLKMGLIRSGATSLTPYDDKELTSYLWPIVKEIIKTAIENKQNLIIEGCYIPFDYKEYFSDEELSDIKYCCLIMTEHYINNHYQDILRYANVIENRKDDSIPKQTLIKQNNENLAECLRHGCHYVLIENSYKEIDFTK